MKIRCGAVEVPGTGALEGYSIATAWDPTAGGKGGGSLPKMLAVFQILCQFCFTCNFLHLPAVTIQDLSLKTYFRTGA